jgi:hypothetical protein
MTVSCIRYNMTSFVGRFARMCKVSKYLHPFYVKRKICQLTDHAYDMRMLTFCNYLVTMLLINC